MDLPFLDIEVVQKKQSCAEKEHVIELVRSFLLSDPSAAVAGNVITELELSRRRRDLAEHVEDLRFCDAGHRPEREHAVHVFRLHDGGPESDAFCDGEGEPAAAALRPLPARDLHGLWDTLRFDDQVHRDALRFSSAALELAARGADPLLAGGGRVLLLHGPPGTGKTSLCRALAHKLAARRGGRAALLEVDAHALFSRWFSESGRLVARLFSRARELAADPRLLLVLLLDEAESLATVRGGPGPEPADGMRAVNALLTQLDGLRSMPNVLVLATSNLAGALDPAFVDRADLRRRVGLPGPGAGYAVLAQGCGELMRAGCVEREELFSLSMLEAVHEAPSATASLRLRGCALAAVRGGLSGRSLRRLPLLALALRESGHLPLSLDMFLTSLERAVQSHLTDADQLSDDINKINLHNNITNGN